MKKNSNYKLTAAQRRAKFTPKKYRQLEGSIQVPARKTRIPKIDNTERVQAAEKEERKIKPSSLADFPVEYSSWTPVSYKFSYGVSKPEPVSSGCLGCIGHESLNKDLKEEVSFLKQIIKRLL